MVTYHLIFIKWLIKEISGIVSLISAQLTENTRKKGGKEKKEEREREGAVFPLNRPWKLRLKFIFVIYATRATVSTRSLLDLMTFEFWKLME